MDEKEKKAGLIAGISIIVMAVAAVFSYGYVQNELVNESAKVTTQNLIENNSLFWAGLAGWIVIFITDLIASASLFLFFRNTMLRVSLITAIFRIIYTLVLGVAIYQLLAIVPLLAETEPAFDINSRFKAFEKIWSAGLIIFGFHLGGLGYLSIKSQFAHRFFGYLLYFASVAYVLIHTAKQLNSIEQTIINTAESILALPMGLSEILLAVLLIYKGVKKLKNHNN